MTAMQIEARPRTRRTNLRTLRTFWRFLRDPRAPALPKLFFLLALAYVAMPVDLIPDVPLIGWLDDAGVLAIALGWIGARLERYAREAEVGEKSEG